MDRSLASSASCEVSTRCSLNRRGVLRGLSVGDWVVPTNSTPRKGAPDGPPQSSTDVPWKSSPFGAADHGRGVDGRSGGGIVGNQSPHGTQVAGPLPDTRPGRALRSQLPAAPHTTGDAGRV